jgi:hypothetical protein
LGSCAYIARCIQVAFGVLGRTCATRTSAMSAVRWLGDVAGA